MCIDFLYPILTCSAEETKLWLSPSAKQCRNPCSGPPPVYQDLSTHHDWPVKQATVDLIANQDERKFQHSSGNLLSLLGAQKEDIDATL